MLLCKLQKGIAIIDSPGVGESDEMDEMVIKYLPEAFAFIYVANSTIAGGVKRDGVSTWIIVSPFRQFTWIEAGRIKVYPPWIEARPVPLALIKCWKVASWNAKTLLRIAKIQKLMLPNRLKFLPKFLDILI